MADSVITPEIIERYKNVAGATVYSAVRQFGYEPCFMRDVHAFTPGGMLVGRAKTLRFVPPRKDIMEETHRGADSPEYQAMGSCEPGDVLVIDGMGKKYAAIGGDVKLLQLKMQGAAGLVTDASIRDLAIVADYGLKVFAGGRTPMGGADESTRSRRMSPSAVEALRCVRATLSLRTMTALWWCRSASSSRS